MESSRRLAAIMFTDIVGYTALMGKDEVRALALLKRNIQIQRPLIERFNGDLLKEMGDGLLVSFSTVSDAVYCAGAIQNACEAEEDLSLRIGIHQGEVVFEGHDVFGDGVNIASRIEAIAPSGGIWVSESVHKNVLNKKGIETRFVREAQLKNVSEPVRIYKAKVASVEAALIAVKPLGSVKTNPRKVLLAAIVILAILVLGYFGNSYFGSSLEADEQTIEKSIAVLPFSNESSNQENLYFCNGIMEGILNHLAKISDLTVMSRSSMEQYRNDRPSVKKMAEELNVQYLIEGSVQRIGDQVVIFAQLIYANSDKHLWSQKYERSLTDVFAVQAEVTEAIAGELQAAISPEVKRRIEVAPTTNIDAYDLYNRGRTYLYSYYSSFDQKHLNNAEGLYKEALEIDSTYALAYVGLGFVHLTKAGFGGNPEINESQYLDSVGQFALKALSFDADLAEAYHLRGHYYYRKDELDKAIVQQRKAISLNPNLAEAYQALSMLNNYYEYDFPKAIVNIKKAISLAKGSPLTPLLYRDFGWLYHKIYAFEKAEYYFRESIRLQPDYFRGYNYLWWLFVAQGKFEQALEVAETACLLKSPQCVNQLAHTYMCTRDFSKALEYWEKLKAQNEKLGKIGIAWTSIGNWIYIHWQLGQKEKAKQLLEESVAFWKDRNVTYTPINLAQSYAAIGDVENAIINLKKFDFRKDWIFSSLMSHIPVFESLWDNEEFKDLVERLSEDKAKIREEIFALEAAGKL